MTAVGDTAAEAWAGAREALADEVDRVTALLRSARRPDAPALGRWSVAEVAVHLSQAFLIVPGLAAGDLRAALEAAPGLAGGDGDSLLGDLWDLGGVTMRGVESDPERDLATLADRIDERATRFLAATAGQADSDPRPWLVKGTSLPLAALTCHLLNETIVHGYDLARAERRRWAIPALHARQVLEGFLIPVFRAVGPRAMLDQARAAGFRATYDLRLRGGGRYFFVLDDGVLTIEEPSSRPVDCRVSAEPVAFLLVGWGRRSQWSAIATGALTAWGRKPWLGMRFRSLMRNP